jgi:lysophospholipase L1-like esterase
MHPVKRIGPFLTIFVVSACGVITNPIAPVDPGASSAVVYSAVGASDANGVGGSVPCLPYVACPDGTGYVPVVARKYTTAGKAVTLQNLGVPGAVLSKTIQDLGNQMNYGILINFLADEMPFIKTDSTLVTVFAGANDANTIGSAIKAGLAGSDPVSWVNAQIATFGRDMVTLVAGIKARAPKARIVILNLPNLAALPYSDGRTLSEKQALQTIAVGLNEKINAMASQGATVVDMMCDGRLYNRAIFSSDGFHPNDTGYALFAELVYGAASSTTPTTPKSSCAYMSQF